MFLGTAIDLADFGMRHIGPGDAIIGPRPRPDKTLQPRVGPTTASAGGEWRKRRW
jgi:hypothetical protein